MVYSQTVPFCYAGARERSTPSPAQALRVFPGDVAAAPLRPAEVSVVPALEQGLVQVYTGEGKGKTTAALGLILRATGWQLRSYLVQFMKHQPTGEIAALRLLAPYVTFEQFGRPGFVLPGKATPEDISLAHQGLQRAREVLVGGEYDLVVLDEVNTAVSLGLLTEQEVLDVIAARPRHVELVLTGRGASAGILGAADLVTRMLDEKHPLQHGVGARRGIEY